MSTIILIIIVWVMYGMYAVIQAKEYIDRKDKEYADKGYYHSEGEYRVWTTILYITIAPAIFIGKSMYGAFKKYK